MRNIDSEKSLSERYGMPQDRVEEALKRTPEEITSMRKSRSQKRRKLRESRERRQRKVNMPDPTYVKFIGTNGKVKRIPVGETLANRMEKTGHFRKEEDVEESD